MCGAPGGIRTRVADSLLYSRGQHTLGETYLDRAIFGSLTASTGAPLARSIRLTLTHDILTCAKNTRKKMERGFGLVVRHSAASRRWSWSRLRGCDNIIDAQYHGCSFCCGSYGLLLHFNGLNNALFAQVLHSAFEDVDALIDTAFLLMCGTKSN